MENPSTGRAIALSLNIGITIEIGSLEPVTSICHPPADVNNRHCRRNRPPERQHEVSDQSQHEEEHPEHAFLHKRHSIPAPNGRGLKGFPVDVTPVRNATLPHLGTCAGV
jgi:hypothetical protein